METTKLVAVTMNLNMMKTARRALRRIEENNRARWSTHTRNINASLRTRLDQFIKAVGLPTELDCAASATLVCNVTEAKTIRRALRRVVQNPRWSAPTRSINSGVAGHVHAALLCAA